MAGLRGTDGDFGGLEVANFSNEHNVWIVAKHRAQAGREGETDLFANWNLHCAFKLIFDGIFKSNNFSAIVVGLSERRIKSRGFAAVRWPGEQHHALG